MDNREVAAFYNTIDGKVGSAYEEDRWFRTPITQSHYEMTRKAILRTLKGRAFTSCLELGPGAGTWTKLLYAHEPTAQFTLVDISETMLNMARKNLGSIGASVTFHVSDFLKFEATQTYDFFFSSRALEYIDDTQKAVAIISSLLTPSGEGVLITKYPRYWAYRLFGRTVPKLHRGQIAPSDLTRLLEKEGLIVRCVRPATTTVPLFRSSILNRAAHSLLQYFWFVPIHMFFTESYVIHFTKRV